MKWTVVLEEGGRSFEIAVTASISEKQQLKRLIQQQYPQAKVTQMTHSSDAPPPKRNQK